MKGMIMRGRLMRGKIMRGRVMIGVKMRWRVMIGVKMSWREMSRRMRGRLIMQLKGKSKKVYLSYECVLLL